MVKNSKIEAGKFKHRIEIQNNFAFLLNLFTEEWLVIYIVGQKKKHIKISDMPSSILAKCLYS